MRNFGCDKWKQQESAENGKGIDKKLEGKYIEDYKWCN